MSDKLNMNNVSRITCKTSESGKVTAKKKDKVTVTAKITLKNGTTKTVKMTVTVK